MVGIWQHNNNLDFTEIFKYDSFAAVLVSAAAAAGAAAVAVVMILSADINVVTGTTGWW